MTMMTHHDPSNTLWMTAVKQMTAVKRVTAVGRVAAAAAGRVTAVKNATPMTYPEHLFSLF